MAGVGTVRAVSPVEGELSHGQGLVNAVACQHRQSRDLVASLVLTAFRTRLLVTDAPVTIGNMAPAVTVRLHQYIQI